MGTGVRLQADGISVAAVFRVGADIAFFKEPARLLHGPQREPRQMDVDFLIAVNGEKGGKIIRGEFSQQQTRRFKLRRVPQKYLCGDLPLQGEKRS